MRNLLKKIMNQPALIERPPVLIDIGASGWLPQQWKLIAPYSICIAFDADTRDFSMKESENRGWKKLYTLNRLVAAGENSEIDFFLTKSPHCSSSLKPDNLSLEPWAFRNLFEIEKVVKLPSVSLKNALENIGIEYIDWYKTDSQGTDLRIFNSLTEEIRKNILTAEFEPGIIDAYLGEDKLHGLMAYMEQYPFWITDMQIKGSHRIDQYDYDQLNFIQKKSLESFLKKAPGWCEISYLNTLENDDFSVREFLLAWTFSTIKEEYGFALHSAKIGAEKFNLPLFIELQKSSSSSLNSGYLKYSNNFIKRVVNKIFGS